MKLIPTALPDIVRIQPQIFEDDRGYFFESYNQQAFSEAGLTIEFVQDNQSFSRQGTLRGLHYQLSPMAQAKLIRVIQGEIFDVAVDIRPHSPTYGKWVGLSLTSNTHDMIFIPEGFAHGFYVISEIALIQYKCSRFYSPQYERALLWNDPKINIHWPLIRHIPLVISEKDQKGFRFHELEFLLK